MSVGRLKPHRNKQSRYVKLSEKLSYLCSWLYWAPKPQKTGKTDEKNCAKQLIPTQLAVSWGTSNRGEAQPPRWRAPLREIQLHGSPLVGTAAAPGSPAQLVLAGRALQVLTQLITSSSTPGQAPGSNPTVACTNAAPHWSFSSPIPTQAQTGFPGDQNSPSRPYHLRTCCRFVLSAPQLPPPPVPGTHYLLGWTFPPVGAAWRVPPRCHGSSGPRVPNRPSHQPPSLCQMQSGWHKSRLPRRQTPL